MSVSGERWQIGEGAGIAWDLAADTRLPHEDHLEMSGRHVAVIVRFRVNADRRVALSKQCIWPTLRIDPHDVRGYLRRTFGPEDEPALLVDGQPWTPGPAARITFDGALTVEYEPRRGVAAVRTVQPSLGSPEVYDEWRLKTGDGRTMQVRAVGGLSRETVDGMYGAYRVASHVLPRDVSVGREASQVNVVQRHQATLPRSVPRSGQGRPGAAGRTQLIEATRQNLVLETPDLLLNRAFEMAKLRAAESVFQTRRGLMHSPGGGRYYGGVWANDQAEYAGPLFPFLGVPAAIEASLNCYRLFALCMAPDFAANIPSSLEMEGDIPFHAGGDRGDAAMVAYGASRFALALGDRVTAEELWPAIQWCLEYCRRKTNRAGVVESDTDELEGRFPTGRANLSTSALTYGGLRAAASLGESLGHVAQAAEYEARAAMLRRTIEAYFGAEVEGHRTYRYYDGNAVLRAWICLPLAMGILDRAEGTVAALFSPSLWTPDGLATEAGGTVFWDRSTLYALRGVLAAGETQTALRHLTAYTRRRLLGDHVPYAVEAWPEGDQAHLSAESALYCRVFTEGLFGITPTGLRSFSCVPRLPDAWPAMALRRVHAFGAGPDGFDVDVARQGGGVELVIAHGGAAIYREARAPGEVHQITLP